MKNQSRIAIAALSLGTLASLAGCGAGEQEAARVPVQEFANSLVQGSGVLSELQGVSTLECSVFGTNCTSALNIPPVVRVPTPTYAVASAQAIAFDALNTARGQCGFGLLAQSAVLDKAATAHAQYQATNAIQTHTEQSGLPGFTGVNLADRLQAAGYTLAAAGEDIGPVVPGGNAADAVRNLLATPYHEWTLLAGYRDVGLAWSHVAGFDMLTADLGTARGASAQVPSGVLTYPCQGTSQVLAVAPGESPSPFPSTPGATWGQPIIVRGPYDLTISSASITGPLGSVQIQTIFGDGQTADPNQMGLFTRGFFAIIPAPLQSGSTYNVTINYRTGAGAGVRAFSFTTR